jgi:signal transduction histidine kinase
VHCFGFIAFILLLCGAFAIGYVISKLLFRLTGSPSEPAAYVIASMLGVVAASTFVRLFRLIFGRARGRSRKNIMHAEYFMSDALDAINRISKGDFSVFVQVNESMRTPFGELAESINKMAHELGSMEQLRQTFISDVSHEIQSPLTSISGFAALLRKEGATKEEVLHYAAIIETESRRLSKLSENLLKLSALEADIAPFEMKVFRLDKQIENVLLSMEPQWAGKNISPELALDKISANGNEDLLGQVWINLLHNAIKFTPERGVVRVTLTEDNGDLRCIIADNGIGIPQEDQIHIFERFYKADKSRDRALGGNGLGLSLVKKIVELHGGHVSVESEPGGGAVFTVYLPIRQGAQDTPVSK